MLDRHPKIVRKKCVIYCRVSSTKQTSDGAGLTSQEQSCREYAERCGYDILDVFTDVISGKYAVRPGMNALIAYLKSVKAHEYVVVFDDVSRLARDVGAYTELRGKITSLGAVLESPKQKFGEDSNSRLICIDPLNSCSCYKGEGSDECDHGRQHQTLDGEA